jgi:7-keto-8-aminopelargonate synthetase-like enzyme
VNRSVIADNDVATVSAEWLAGVRATRCHVVEFDHVDAPDALREKLSFVASVDLTTLQTDSQRSYNTPVLQVRCS